MPCCTSSCKSCATPCKNTFFTLGVYGGGDVFDGVDNTFQLKKCEATVRCREIHYHAIADVSGSNVEVSDCVTTDFKGRFVIAVPDGATALCLTVELLPKKKQCTLSCKKDYYSGECHRACKCSGVVCEVIKAVFTVVAPPP